MSETYVALTGDCTSSVFKKVKSLVLKRLKPPKGDLQTGLYYAVVNGHDAIVTFFLEHGARIDEIATTGARKCRSAAIFQVLLDPG
jgi:hypothetical protein